MHATQKIGLIAGQGSLPDKVITRWIEQGYIPVVVGLQGITPPSVLSGHRGRMFSIGQAGHILDFLKSEGVTKLVMVGGLKRPNFWTLRTDVVGLRIILKLLFRKVGDDTLLRTIRNEIEKWGIHVVGVHEFLPELLCPSGVLGDVQPDMMMQRAIADGVHAAKAHGAADKGQSVVVDAVSGQRSFETQSGTNALIASCAGWAAPVLVKVSKPQQDLAFDMPTIGVSTVENCHAAGFKGIAVEAGKTLIIDRDGVIRLCNTYGMFIVGIGDSYGI